MSAPAKLTHVTEAMEIFKVDVGHISTAELLAQGRHSGPRAAGLVIPGNRNIYILFCLRQKLKVSQYISCLFGTNLLGDLSQVCLSSMYSISSLSLLRRSVSRSLKYFVLLLFLLPPAAR